MINLYLSNKLKAISFFLMIMVVFLHSFNLALNMSDGTVIISKGYSSFIQNFMSYGLARVAVPLFFIISGYLFFVNIKWGSFEEFASRFKKRFKTLVIPYLFWSLFSLFVYYLMQLVPASEAFFANELVRNYSLSELLDKIFITPFAYQLWFIRDLIILVLITPVIYYIAKYTNVLLAVITFFIWCLDVDCIFVSSEALFFFIVGSYLGVKKIKIQPEKGLSYSYLFLWFFLLIVKTYLVYMGSENEWLIALLNKASILVGIVAVWGIYDKIFLQKDIAQQKYFSLFSYSFILYVLHEPFLSVMKKTLYYLMGVNELSSLLTYLLAPAITIIVVILAGMLFKKSWRSAYDFTTGNR